MRATPSTVAFLVVLAPMLLPGSTPNAVESAEEAFCRYATTPGQEHLAVRIARPHPAEFLPLVVPLGGVSRHRVKLVEGDLRLALGEKEKALTCYRLVAAGLDPDDYPVEPPLPRPGSGEDAFEPLPVEPLVVGPGSHRDNWLLRRFIALEAVSDAASEFARVWRIHRANTCPRVVIERDHLPTPPSAPMPRFILTPAGFDGKGLLFALDYAYFLKRRGDTDGALRLLLEAAAEMDMDRNPSVPWREPLPAGAPAPYPERVESRARRTLWRASAGISRKEFLRLAYGEFALAGQADQFGRFFEGRIAAGENGARRVLARIRIIEGRKADALALELEYIEKAQLDALTTACRRGRAFEDSARLPEAVAEYEKALAMPYTKPSLPDAEEEDYQDSMMAQRGGPIIADNPVAFSQEILGRLQRLYAAMGNTARVLDLDLLLLESNVHSLDAIERTLARFRTAGEEARALSWIREHAAEATQPASKANLCWMAGDRAGAIRALASWQKVVRSDEPGRLDQWKERFRKVGSADHIALLEALVEAKPQDAQSRLELLDAKGIAEGPAYISSLEDLLEYQYLPHFAAETEAQRRTRFRNHYDLAYRLLRLYERLPGEESRLLALGFRILEGERPFSRKEGALVTPSIQWTRRPSDFPLQDTLNCLYVFLAHLRRPEDIERAAAVIEKSGSIPLQTQLRTVQISRNGNRVERDRRPETEYVAVKVRTLCAEEGVRILASRDDVWAIAPGARWGDRAGNTGLVWVGTSWGLVRYRETPGPRLEILQVPTGAGVTALVSTPAGLYAGTRDGLYRVDAPEGDTPRLVRVAVEAADGETRDRVETSTGSDGITRQENVHIEFPIEELLWWKDHLWMSTARTLKGIGIYRYDPKSRKARHFADLEPGLFTGRGRLFSSKAVYDPATDEFRAIEGVGREWRLIGATEDEVWSDVLVEGVGHRPAILDMSTLTLRVLPVTETVRGQPRQADPFVLLGEKDGRVWFSEKGIMWRTGPTPHVLVYDWKKRELTRHLGDVPAEVAPLRHALRDVKLELRGIGDPRLSFVALPGGRYLVGNALRSDFGYHVEGNIEAADLEGGLFFVDTAARQWRRIGASLESLAGSQVKKLVRDGDRAYVCTNGGLTILSMPDGNVAKQITVSDGLPSNAVEDAVRIGERLYIACDRIDKNGGLAAYDLRRGLVQVEVLPARDRSESDRVYRLAAEGDRLHVLGPTYRCFVLDTRSGRVTGAEAHPDAAPPKGARPAPMPVLGGNLLQTNSGHPELIAGTRGLLIAKDDVTEKPRRREEVIRVRSERLRQLEDAERRPVDGTTREDVVRGLADRNPLYRARVVEALYRWSDLSSQYVPELLRCLHDPEPRVRSTALYALSRLPAQERFVDATKERLADPEREIRALATVMLCRQGSVPDSSFLREILTRAGWGGIPLGASSTLTWQDHRELYTALAPHADARIFAVLVENPPNLYPPGETEYASVLGDLGRSLLTHPDAVATLLRAREAAGILFTEAVFRHAGKGMLPALHDSLRSMDRIVRSNAARACGALGDASSIAPLLRALDLESGLSRASIVRALGALKAREALPALAGLWAEAQSDERRRRGVGFRGSQSGAEASAQYASIANLDALGAEWTELKQAALLPSDNPSPYENRLTPRMILEAVRAIGPTVSQDFYRTLAGNKETNARTEAAARLAECAPSDAGRNVVILKNLLADPEVSVQISAAVSLLILEQDLARAPLLGWLAGKQWEQRRAVMELSRVTDPSRLDFARDALRAIAEGGTMDREVRSAAKALVK